MSAMNCKSFLYNLTVTGGNNFVTARREAAKFCMQPLNCHAWPGHEIGQMLLRGRPFEKILLFPKFAQQASCITDS